MDFSIVKIELVTSLTLSLFLCFLYFAYWISRTAEKAYLWLILLFAGNSLYAMVRLLQYAQMDEAIYPLLSRLTLTSGLIFLWSIYNFINAYINYKAIRREIVVFTCLVIAGFLLIWFTDLILTNQLVIRTQFTGDTFTGVKLGPLYPFGMMLSYVIIFLFIVRLLRSNFKKPSEKYLLSGALMLIILFGLNDTATILFDLSWIQFFDIYAVPFGLTFTYTQVKRHSRLYNQLEVMVQERTDSLQQINIDLQNQILEREKVEIILRESEEKYRHLIENANDAILITQDWKIKYLNPRTEEMTGYRKDELMKIPVTTLIHPEDNEKVTDMYKNRMAGMDVPSSYTFRIINKSGDILWVQLNTVLITWGGRPASLNYLRDITQEKKMEIQLNQSQRMEAVGTLAGGIAHEFNNILGIILGNAELAMDDIKEWNPAREFIDEIYEASIRGRDIVKQLLSYSQKSEGRHKILNTTKIIKDSLKYLRAIIPTNIEYRQNITENCYNIFGDATQIHQVMMNLYKNAADAINGEGIIEIILQNVENHHEDFFIERGVPVGKYVRIEVNDSGHGISSDNMKRIFDPFFTTKEVGKGSGMGLAVVHGIINEHNGFINIESEFGKGTNVTLYFPATGKKLTTVETKIETPIYGTENILFVDDEESVTSSTSRRLEKLGYKVEAFTNPLDAFSRFNSDPLLFDLIITDMAMPNMSGDKLIEKIHEVKEQVPSILCTGYSEKINEEQATEMGISAFLIKPITIENLAETIRKVLD